VSGLAGAALVVLLSFPWYGSRAELRPFEATLTAWEAFTAIDVVLLLVGAAAAAMVVLEAARRGDLLPIDSGALAAGLGALASGMILYRLIEPPFSTNTRFGAYLALVAALGIWLGGLMTMRERRVRAAHLPDQLAGRVIAPDEGPRTDTTAGRRGPRRAERGK
jgi:hypothetical protein